MYLFIVQPNASLCWESKLNLTREPNSWPGLRERKQLLWSHHKASHSSERREITKHTILCHYFSTPKPCQYLMLCPLKVWCQLSFVKKNVLDVSVLLVVYMYSSHWCRYNGLDNRTNDICAERLFSLCLLLKDLIMCNLMPRQTPHHWFHLLLFPITQRTKLLFFCRLMAASFYQPTVIPLVAWGRWCNWSVKTLMPENFIWESDHPSQLLTAAQVLIRIQASYYLQEPR